MDNRNVRSGDPIPVSNYSDQPYVVKTDDGGWLMVVTTGAGTEGSKGQHITSAKSFDCGKTWSDKWYEIPQRVMETDRSNPYGGKVLYFWNVGKPFTLDNSAFVLKGYVYVQDGGRSFKMR